MMASLRMCTAPLVFLVSAGLLQGAAEPAQGTGKTPTLEPRCARPFADNAVFQQNMPIPVWGWSQPGADITLTFDGQTKTTVAGTDGTWRVVLDPLSADKLASVHEAPAGRTLTIVAKVAGKVAAKSVNNILIGEVWLCSGQSNMAGKFGRAPYPPGSLADANYPALRNFEDQWTSSTPETAGSFSRVAFSFARKLQGELMVPVGLMTSAVGGTQIESWMANPPEDIKKPNAKVLSENGSGVHYAAKIAPLVGYGMRGAIWYQGEGNEKDRRSYFPKMQSLIGDWRMGWGQGDFPFYFVQIAPIGKSPTDQPAGGDGRAEIRNAQMQALSIKNTGMAVTIDIGFEKEHPIK